ncbi:MAG: TIM barrel protein [Isosphaeraceae bacterium]|nr:TIM barrel protein [Isosphaeraceae bacterium]
MRSLLCAWLVLSAFATLSAAEPATVEASRKLFGRDNLVAWCIVPFDVKNRGPEERAAMLRRLGFTHFAYDWRAEHVPTFDAELDALEKNGVELTAFWFPGALNKDAQAILDVLERHKVHTQLWVTMGDPAPTAKDEAEKVAAGVRALRPIADAAAKIGCTVALYNHGGWFGEPENEIAIIKQLDRPNVGIVYNLHHGHTHLDRFPALLKTMMPYLLALNLNGMVTDGDQHGQKIVPLGQGPLDLALLKTIRDSGYRGPIGILGHTQEDAEARLHDNLDGLDWLVPQLDGRAPGPKPKPRTTTGLVPTQAANAPAESWIVAGRPEYRTLPLTVECRVKLDGKESYNILVASDTKASGAHWELFSMVGTGALSVYLPGMEPDHVRSDVDVCDGTWHGLTMQYEPRRVRLYRDGKLIADQPVTPQSNVSLAGDLAIGGLVEGGFGCRGTIASVRLSRGVREVESTRPEGLRADGTTIGLWVLGSKGQPSEDRSTLHNTAQPRR